MPGVCETCGKHDVTASCSRCGQVWYCNRECQAADWKSHRVLCKVASASSVAPRQSSTLNGNILPLKAIAKSLQISPRDAGPNHATIQLYTALQEIMAINSHSGVHANSKFTMPPQRVLDSIVAALKAGADACYPMPTDDAVMTMLHLLCWYGADRMIELLFKHSKVSLAFDSQQPHPTGRSDSTLVLAIKSGSIQLVLSLLKAGANPNLPCIMAEKSDPPTLHPYLPLLLLVWPPRLPLNTEQCVALLEALGDSTHPGHKADINAYLADDGFTFLQQCIQRIPDCEEEEALDMYLALFKKALELGADPCKPRFVLPSSSAAASKDATPLPERAAPGPREHPFRPIDLLLQTYDECGSAACLRREKIAAVESMVQHLCSSLLPSSTPESHAPLASSTVASPSTRVNALRPIPFATFPSSASLTVDAGASDGHAVHHHHHHRHGDGTGCAQTSSSNSCDHDVDSASRGAVADAHPNGSSLGASAANPVPDSDMWDYLSFAVMIGATKVVDTAMSTAAALSAPAASPLGASAGSAASSSSSSSISPRPGLDLHRHVTKDADAQPLLIVAVDDNRDVCPPLIEVLLKHGCDPHQADGRGRTAIQVLEGLWASKQKMWGPMSDEALECARLLRNAMQRTAA